MDGRVVLVALGMSLTAGRPVGAQDDRPAVVRVLGRRPCSRCCKTVAAGEPLLRPSWRPG